MRLFLSAGHYPKARGAAWRGFIEHDEATEWVKAIAVLLPEAYVVPTGPLADKVRWINDRCTYTDLCVEIHFNASASGAGQGCETLCWPRGRNGQWIASVVQAALEPLFPPSRGVKERRDLYLINSTLCHSLIVEPEFIYHADRIRGKRPAACLALAGALGGFL